MASGDLLAVLKPAANEAPASNAATPALRNSHLLLAFPSTADTEAVWSDRMPPAYGGGGITATVVWAAEDTTVGPDNAVWQGAFELIGDDAQDMDSDSFAAFQSSGAVAEPSASGETSEDTITFTDGAQIDNVVANKSYRFKLRRDTDGTSGTNTLSGNAQVKQVILKET